ncbi:hypothetical protein N7470_000885 [Penicillium chermesinum]|nr:hypothetical protein N7470_000885 [Penicillium chermesinum]
MTHALPSLLVLGTYVNAHSWIEQLTVIAPNGTFIGEPGYARGNVLRTAPGFSDPTMVNLIPPEHSRIQKGSPRLQASAGAAVALRYQENGHVTLPQNQPGKPKNRGTIYVYGTTQPKKDETLLNVHGKWNREGTGGDGSGVLLSKQNFDDSRCYQINSGEISTTRQKEYPHQANQLMGADLWCQQDIQLPSNAPTGKPYTLYWVWDWPTLPGGDPTYPDGKQEIYTTCMDIDVVESPNSQTKSSFKYAVGQDLNSASIQSEFEDLENASDPQPAGSASSASLASAVSPASSTLSKDPTSASAGAPTSTYTVTMTETAAATTEWVTKTQVYYVCPQTATLS